MVLALSFAALAVARSQLWHAPANPFRGVRLYVNLDGPAARVARDLAGSDPAQARVLGRLGATPQAIWFGDWVTTNKVASRVRAVVEAATSSATVPLFVIYNVPHRDCDQHSAGGAPDAASYRSWVLAFAAGISQGKAFVVIEPDALAQLDCLTAVQRAERLELLRFAVDALSAYPRVVSYLDAGHRAWTAPAEMASRLRDADIRKVRGFSVNVSFYDTTTAEITYGKTISDLVDRKPFVIDTSRNGRGRASGPSGWCNPPGRALGPTPLTAPGDNRVDALLWIKTPGVSDGDCRRGEPHAGVFWIERAVQLATAAGW